MPAAIGPKNWPKFKTPPPIIPLLGSDPIIYPPPVKDEDIIAILIGSQEYLNDLK